MNTGLFYIAEYVLRQRRFLLYHFIMDFIVKTIKSFSLGEILLLAGSLIAEAVLFAFLPEKNWLSFSASLLGILTIIFMAKGNVLGHCLSIGFSVLYSMVSFREGYYGEMIAYLGINIPICLVAIILWIRNPSASGNNEVKIKKTGWKDLFIVLGLATPVAAAAFFLLYFLGTSNLVLNAASLYSCIIADLLTWRRSKYYAVAFCVNDAIIIAMWTIASLSNFSNIVMVGCFVIFLVNDLYGFIDWQRREKIQTERNEIDTD